MTLDDRNPPPQRSPAQLLGEAAMAVPRLLQTLVALMRDPRVPSRRKLVAGVVVAYVVSPIDVLPDAIPFLGRLDDVVLVAAAIDLLLDAAPPDVVEEYWRGSEDSLEIVSGLARFIGGMVPRPVRRLLRGLGTAPAAPSEPA